MMSGRMAGILMRCLIRPSSEHLLFRQLILLLNDNGSMRQHLMFVHYFSTVQYTGDGVAHSWIPISRSSTWSSSQEGFLSSEHYQRRYLIMNKLLTSSNQDLQNWGKASQRIVFIDILCEGRRGLLLWGVVAALAKKQSSVKLSTQHLTNQPLPFRVHIRDWHYHIIVLRFMILHHFTCGTVDLTHITCFMVFRPVLIITP